MLVDSTKRANKSQTIGEFYTELIDALKKANKLGNSYAYRDSINSIKSFVNAENVDLLFSEIDRDWLNKYERWLDDRNIADITKSLLPKTLRSTFYKTKQTTQNHRTIKIYNFRHSQKIKKKEYINLLQHSSKLFQQRL